MAACCEVGNLICVLIDEFQHMQTRGNQIEHNN